MKSRRERIELQTSITPHSVAAAVVEEASVWLGVALPRQWVRQLAERANTVYSRNAVFRRSLRVKGNAGRDRLWAFTRHWLCALIAERDPELHGRLPGFYNVGYDLPAKRVACVGLKRRNRVSESWAAAAHFHVGTVV